jgi:hypothetical protein
LRVLLNIAILQQYTCRNTTAQLPLYCDTRDGAPRAVIASVVIASRSGSDRPAATGRQLVTSRALRIV